LIREVLRDAEKLAGRGVLALQLHVAGEAHREQGLEHAFAANPRFTRSMAIFSQWSESCSRMAGMSSIIPLI
jgi:hypothetical protein